MTHVDPVCGMSIEDADAAGTHEHDGVTYYFCNTSCLERFKKDPKAFLEAVLDRAPKPRDFLDVLSALHALMRELRW